MGKNPYKPGSYWDKLRQERLASEKHKKELEYHREYRKSEKQKAYFRAYRQAEREKRRSLHICVICGKEDAFYNFRECPACIEKRQMKAIKSIHKKEKAGSKLAHNCRDNQA